MQPKRELLDAVSIPTTAATSPLRMLQPQQQQHWQQPTFYAAAAPQYFMAPMYSAPLPSVAQPSNPQIHINATHGNVQVKVSQPPPQQPHYLPPPHGLCAASCCQMMPYGGYVSYGLGQEHVMYAPANDFMVSVITVKKDYSRKSEQLEHLELHHCADLAITVIFSDRTWQPELLRILARHA